VPDNALFTVTPDQQSWPELVWGGGFGPEGTLGASLVLLALIVFTLRRRAKIDYEVAATTDSAG
jgi:hypothetical protein